MLLESLVACSGVTLRAVATSLGIPVDGGHVTAYGDLDFKVSSPSPPMTSPSSSLIVI